MTRRTRFKLLTAALALSVLFLAAQVSAEPPEGHICADDWIAACVGSTQDKYRNRKPVPLHTPEEMMRLLNEGVHICELTDAGPCAGLEPASGMAEWVDMGDNGMDFE